MDNDEIQKQKRANAYAALSRDSYTKLHQRQAKVYADRLERDDFTNLGPLNHKSLGRLRYALSLTDISLGCYVGDAKQKAKVAYLGGFRNWHHHYTSGIADVTIDLRGRSVQIRIVPVDSFYCEFATTGLPVTQGVVNQDGVGFFGAQGLVIGVDVGIIQGQTKVAARIRKNQRSKDSGYTESKIHRQYQIQLISEPVGYPQGVFAFNRWNYGRALYESYAPGTAHTGVPFRNSLRGTNLDAAEIAPNPGPTEPYDFRDTGFDVPFEDQHGTNPVRLAYIRGAADWPRANGLQVVDHPTYGKREFAIYVDANNVFNVFPTAAILPLSTVNPYLQNVPDTHVQRLTPTIPGWVYVPSMRWTDYYPSSNPGGALVDQGLIDGPELDWKFNHLGTKAASIVYERSAYNFDTSYWASHPTGTPFTSTMFNTDVVPTMGIGSRVNVEKTPGYNEQRYFTATGILQVAIAITLTGSNLEDYTAVLTVTEVQRPTSDLPCPMLCGYVWYDIYKPDKKTILAAAGTFVSVDVEQWADGVTQSGKTSVVIVRNLDTSAEILTYRGNPLVGCDLTTLSFAFFVQELLKNEKQTFPLRSGAPGAPGNVTVDMFHHSFGICIVALGQVKEFLWPDTLPQGKRDTLTAIMMGQTGREYIASLVALNPLWVRVPVFQPRDGWGDSDINNVRDVYSQLWGFRSNGYVPGVNYTATEFLMFSTWRPRIGEPGHLLYCDNPRWGWHDYECAIADHMRVGAFDTFYTHPNGTYAYFSNTYVYNPQGMCNQQGFNWYAETLATFDVQQFEHVIFDRVHFEIRAGQKVLGHHDTTYVKLYNAAVKAGMQSGKLLDAVNPLDASNLRATFEYGDYEFDHATFPGWKILNFSAEWDGVTYYFIETGVHGGPYYNSVLGQQGPLVGLSFSQPWASTPGYGTGSNPFSDRVHVRFTGLSISVPEITA